jgi:FkbM family methyltransferase
MNQLEINEQLLKWRSDNGDQTHNLNYELNPDSIVIDLGGYEGIWGQKITNKYDCNLYIAEPITEYYNILTKKFASNSKVKILNAGVYSENKDSIIYVKDDTSSCIECDSFKSTEKIKLFTLRKIFEIFQIDKADLLQINIEGCEYDLLEALVNEEILKRIKNFQVQFHTNIENYNERRYNIHQKLILNGFVKKFDYPFVWEGWENIN